MKNTSRLALVFAASILSSTHALAEKTAGENREFTVHKSLVYSDADESLKLDLFLPRVTAEPVPCVVVIQGGGFLAQDGQKFRPFAEHLAKNGFAAALVAYRGRPDHTYPDTIADIKASVRFIRKVSGDYRIASDKIGATGRSAGATLAALLAVTANDETLEGKGGHPEFSGRIQAAVGISGVYDFVARFVSEDQKALQPNWKVKKKTNGEWVGPPFSSGNNDWIQASATNHIDAEDPPLLLIHSKNDTTVPWLQSQNFYDAMKAVGMGSEIMISKTGGHSGPGNAKDLMVDFFKKTLVESDERRK